MEVFHMKKILLVDDQPHILKDLIDYLKRTGCGSDYIEYESIYFSDRAVERIKQGGLDLLILDYNLGTRDMNGGEIARKARALYPSLKILFYSSDGDCEFVSNELGIPQFNKYEEIEEIAGYIKRELLN